MEVYLDNAATTKVFPSVIESMKNVMEVSYGNPSSMHRKGMEAENHIKDAKNKIAKSLKVDPKEIIFTSGGSESNNMALIGAALANHKAGKHIITTAFEHPSVHQPLLALKEEGFHIDFVPVNRYGKVIKEKLLELICEDTILVSIMYVNNEIGAIQDIATLSEAVKQKKHTILFHVDAIQAFGKYYIYPKREGIDLLSVSGHKIHGPKGIGFLYIKDKVKVRPFIFGGGQQKGIRSGTENVPAIAGLSKAVEECYTDFENKILYLNTIKQYLINGLLSIEGVIIHAIFLNNDDTKELSNIVESAPHIVSAGFYGIKAEVLLHALEDAGIYVSSGSACATNHPSISQSLQAILVEEELLDATIRFSLSVYNTKEEIAYTIEVLKKIVPILRKYRRK